MSDLWLKLFVSTTPPRHKHVCSFNLAHLQAPTKTMCVPGGALQRLRPPSGKWPPPQQRWWGSPVVGRARLKVNSQTDQMARKDRGKNTFEVEKTTTLRGLQSSHSLHGTNLYISLHLPYEKQVKVGDSCSHSIRVWYISLRIYHTNSTIHGYR